MEIVRIPIDQLTPDPTNAKDHPKEQVDQIIKSIDQLGNLDPIGVWGKDNLIVEGHGRYLALKKLGYKEAECIRLDSLTEEERKAYALIHNKLTMNTGFIPEALDMNLEAITDIDMSQFGFDVSMFEETPEAAEDDFDEDSAPDNIHGVRRGDVWQCGDHRVMCGDSSSAEDFTVLMGGQQADMVFTDPPYGVAIGDKNKALDKIQRSGRVKTNIEGDTMSAEDLYQLLVSAMTNVRENCRDDACYWVTSPQGGDLGLMMMQMMKDAGLPIRHILMWNKSSATFSIGRLDYDYKHEPIFYTWTKSHNNRRKGKFRNTVWDIPKPVKCDKHPTMKPVELVANCILDGSDEGGIVLDAFGGSGTTMIAAEQTGRKARLMEIDPHYVDVIIQRWEALTGREAVKA